MKKLILAILLLATLSAFGAGEPIQRSLYTTNLSGVAIPIVGSSLSLTNLSNAVLTASSITYSNGSYPVTTETLILVTNATQSGINGSYGIVSTNAGVRRWTNSLNNGMWIIQSTNTDVSGGSALGWHKAITNAGSLLWGATSPSLYHQQIFDEQEDGTGVEPQIIQTNLLSVYSYQSTLTMNGYELGTNRVRYVDPLRGSDNFGGYGPQRPYATISVAVAAAVSNDVVFLLPGTFSVPSSFSIPAGVNLIGSGRGVSFVGSISTNIGPAIACGGYNTVRDLTHYGYIQTGGPTNLFEDLDVVGGVDGVLGAHPSGSYNRFINCNFSSYYDTFNDGGDAGTVSIVEYFNCNFWVRHQPGVSEVGRVFCVGPNLWIRVWGGSILLENFNGICTNTTTGGIVVTVAGGGSKVEFAGTRISTPSTNANPQGVVAYFSGVGTNVFTYGPLIDETKVYGGSITRMDKVANYTSYAAGTAYTLTATPAQLDFGTTDPSITIVNGGTYLITGTAGVLYSGATYAGAQTLALKLRRTNNTAADLSNGSRSLELPVLTAFTGGDVVNTPGVVYVATAGDIVQLFGSVSALPSAGSVQTTSAEIIAIRLY